MEFIFLSVTTLLITFVTFFTPISIDSRRFNELPLQIASLRESINALAQSLSSSESVPAAQMSPSSSPTTWHAEGTVVPTPTVTGFPYDAAASLWQYATSWLPSTVLKRGDSLPISDGSLMYFLVFLLSVMIFACSLFCVRIQWKTYKSMEQNRRSVTGLLEAFQTDMAEVLKDVEHLKDQSDEHVDSQLQGSQTLFTAVEALTVGLAKVVNGVEELKGQSNEHVDSQLQGFGTRLTAMEALTADLATVMTDLQELKDQLQGFDTRLTALKDTADKNLKDQFAQLQVLIQEQKTTLESQGPREIRVQDFDTDGKVIKDVKQQLLDHLTQECQTPLVDLKEAICTVMDAEAKDLQVKIRKHGTALEQQANDLKARKQTFDATLTTAENAWKTELQRAQNKQIEQNDALVAELTKQREEAQKTLPERVDKLASGFESRASKAFSRFFKETTLKSLITEVLKKELESTLSDLSSGDLTSYAQEQLDGLLKERVKTSLPDPGPTDSAPLAPVRPQGPREEVPKSSGELSSGPQAPQSAPQAGPGSSEAGPSKGKAAEPPKPVEKGLHTSMYAPPASPTPPQTRDKGKQPMKGKAKEVPESSKEPSQGQKGEATGGAPRRSSAHQAGDHKEGKKVPSAQNVVWTCPPPRPSPGTEIEAKEPAKESASKKPAAQPVGAQGSKPERQLKSPLPGKDQSKADTHVSSAAAPGIRSASQTASVPPITGTKLNPTPAVQGSQKESGKESQGPALSRFSPKNLPDGPRLPSLTKPVHRAGLVDENLSYRKVFENLKRQSEQTSAPAAPKKEAGGLAPVKKDETPAVKKEETKAEPNPLVPQSIFQSLPLKEVPTLAAPSAPPATKSETWSDMVEDEIDEAKGTPDANQPPAGPSATTAPAPAEKEPPTASSKEDDPPKKGSKKPPVGMGQSMWAPQAGTDAPKPPEAPKGKKPSGAGGSRWAQ